jgi:hypothetical protein
MSLLLAHKAPSALHRWRGFLLSSSEVDSGVASAGVTAGVVSRKSERESWGFLEQRAYSC